ncbi:MAG: NUDIX domain-containing protein [Candidatus Pacebacteria bacterium]|nr:NUDIX domain-containing protein [Candidatus Paceibacterota bacterium]PIR63173.1 MAG: ADP-ribose pyrophosphatase [Candidatus Pacebacteria bacterium CG10_big_fil_rev_8_21_14_0_10_40_26]PIZ78203.1 MAG: ADP-ribose pyrophosphatase [Candidatus Pacebacteria bacterium CG_4_10_14_0_2_um_filter_40_20]PJA68752.1 MAG: ADP-ribose pyrophosphatase [Candidatus Pacebacteria bacterium CG_4_9_14_3_um_filter_40_12]PJC41692.1 MAG: ADP-ribose pyrophosphatase [Candidatus Pacebacteria bacterium CG_4_9_14_0_2_um_fil
MKLLATLNPQHATIMEISSYILREAARTVVFDVEKNIAILHVTTENYYKLPGGGIEDSESKIMALKRECIEEIGCEIEVIDEIGMIIEQRKMWNMKQISYCYLSRVKGEKKEAEFTQEERDDGFELLWLPFEQALSLISTNVAQNQEGGSYIVPRDTLFLEAAEKFLK